MGLLPVSDEQVASYRPLVEFHARRFAKLKAGTFAEYDDLVQVGLIRVWTNLQRDIGPTSTSVMNAMRDEMRRAKRAGRDGLGGFDETPDES